MRVEVAKMCRIGVVLSVLVGMGVSATAQTAEQVEAEPIVKLQAGETLVPGECLTEQELALIDRLNALRRPTVGQESEGDHDDHALFNPHYFLGEWQVEGVLPETPLGPAGEFYGTENFIHVDGCTYESALEVTVPDGSVTITSLVIYDRRTGNLVRIEDDSRGFELVKVGPVAGDPGGYFSHHWFAPPVTVNGSGVHLTGRSFITSPYAYEVRTRMSTDGGSFANAGTVRWERVD